MGTNDNHSDKKKYPWTAQRILALIGIILLLAMYGSTMVFALMGSPTAKGLLMASIYLTIIVPVLLYAMLMVAKRVRRSNEGMNSDVADSNAETTAESDEKE